jgi:hypothetical protein
MGCLFVALSCSIFISSRINSRINLESKHRNDYENFRVAIAYGFDAIVNSDSNGSVFSDSSVSGTSVFHPPLDILPRAPTLTTTPEVIVARNNLVSAH